MHHESAIEKQRHDQRERWLRRWFLPGSLDLEMMLFRYAPPRAIIALRGKCSHLLQKILGHEHVAHRDAPIEVAEEGGLGVLGQLVVLHCLISIVIRSVQRVLHCPTPPNPTRDNTRRKKSRDALLGFRARPGQVFLTIPSGVQ
jgi:hypothetical protein